ncbi:putative Adenylate kinase isoenzyme 6 like protein [Blattamonas nauphoetae]|uniref:Adenylate kinase isoenzyme 6 homolog n=1 Tax=Blattamonas nauphoetae TaxID=2049346 RepID=A0ABQ9XVU6_9EUKA|nr:putative Adenylate kinase isoenzyme 6 like protein [Blattamonas nauphoetae]
MNILVTGTPGTGKTTLCQRLSEQLHLNYLHFGSFARNIPVLQDLWNEQMQCYDLDDEAENMIMDEMEPLMEQGRCIVEHHDARPFPERWFGLVILLRSSTEQLFDRLSSRQYSQEKVQENIQAEIFNICKEQAEESYSPSIILELQSNTLDDFNSNVDLIQQWLSSHQFQ